MVIGLGVSRHSQRCSTSDCHPLGLLGAFAKLRKASVSYVTFLRPFAPNNSAPTGRIFKEFGFSAFFEYLSSKFQLSLKSDKQRVLYEDVETFFKFMILPCLVRLRVRCISYESCRENRNTHFMSDIFFSLKILPFIR